MNEAEQVVACGRRLVDEGLVVRTWGNLSVRTGEDSMLISPSGLSYESLGADDLVSVRLSDGKWTGSRKPSSENGLHALVYRGKREIGAVIHTHQTYASALSAVRLRFHPVPEAYRSVLGNRLPLAPYALPTTGKLAKSASRALLGSESPVLLLANHGALCTGRSLDEAFGRSQRLEECARRILLDRFAELTADDSADEPAMLAWFASSGNGGAA